MEQGFVDLRRNLPGEGGSEGFWPSFTDIMTVVLMIFMLASIVLIVRNWELVSELRATMEAERVAAEMARTASEASATLEEQLAQAQHTLSELRMRLMQADELRQMHEQQLAEDEQRITALQGELELQHSALQSAERDRLLLDDALQQAEQQNAQLEEGRLRQGARIEELVASLEGVEASNRVQAEELGQLRQQRAEHQQQLLALQGEFTDLKARYDRLVRPARSAQGKQVVEVRYEKRDGGELIQWRRPGGNYQAVSAAQLHRELQGLKGRYPDQLYIKIIIPDDSGLSYNEAWSFTNELLDRYDYYYQE